MKKLFFILAVVIFNCLIACNSDGGAMSATAKKNRDVNTAIMKAYEAGDFSKMGDYIAADAVDHAGETGDVKGLDSIVATMKRYHDQTENMKTEVLREMADDEYVIVWSKVSGTAKTDGMGMKAGQSFTMTGVDIAKFKDGKAVEHWLYMDPKEMMQMMMPSTSMYPASDAIVTNDTAIMNPPKKGN
jgi:predicted SnoaL-like aldol condensation-catalyzing enzyme